MSKYRIKNCSIDTVKIGIPMRSNYSEAVLAKLVAVIPNIATTVAIKYSEDGKKVFAKNNEYLALAYKHRLIRRDDNIARRLYYFSAVFLIEYNEVIVGIVKKHQNSNFISIEIFGLSQYDGNKSAVRQEFLDYILTNMQQPYAIRKLDVAVDFEMSFDEVKKHFKKVFVANYNDTHKKGLKFMPHKDSTVYFQRLSKRSKRTLCLYDKNGKNGLGYELTRFEARYITNIQINSKEDFIDACNNYLHKTSELLSSYA
jgi:hypothetical protein